jgi:hypothetical protein
METPHRNSIEFAVYILHRFLQVNCHVAGLFDHIYSRSPWLEPSFQDCEGRCGDARRIARRIATTRQSSSKQAKSHLSVCGGRIVELPGRRGRPVTRYRAHGTRCLVPGTRYLVPGGRDLVPGTGYMVPGTWYQLPGTWRIARNSLRAMNSLRDFL